MNRLSFSGALIALLAASAVMVSGRFSLAAAGVPTATTLTSSNPAAVHGEKIVLTIHVQTEDGKEPSGIIKIHDGPSSVLTASYPAEREFAVSTLTTRKHELFAEFVGDGTVGSSRSAVLEQAVNKATTTTTILLKGNPLRAGSPVRYNVIVRPVAPSDAAFAVFGHVRYEGGGAPSQTEIYDTLSNFVALGPTPEKAASLTFNANFEGSDDYNPSASAPVVQTIVESGTTMSVSNDTIREGSTISWIAALEGAPGDWVGTIRYSEGGIVLVEARPTPSGYAETTSPRLAIGRHSILAEYVGDSSHGAVSTTKVVDVLPKEPPEISLSKYLISRPSPSFYGKNVTMVTPAELYTYQSKTFEFFDGDQLLGRGRGVVLPAPHVMSIHGELETCVLGPGVHSLFARSLEADAAAGPPPPPRWAYIDHEVLGDHDAGPYSGACPIGDAGADADAEIPPDAGTPPDAGPPDNPTSGGESSGCQSSNQAVSMEGAMGLFAVLGGAFFLRKRRRTNQH
ncbi:Ig-like domain-containing protein [Pendulispora rubella]|uniref:Ig-like domain-containing protein n=1 Tax=Pendulispora rubella TaxID=2741070 RepID=A0ABZ2KP69_9BACT